MGRLDHPLRMRHHPEHVAGLVDDPGDGSGGAVDLIRIAKGDPAFAFEPVERLGIGLVIAVMMGDRDDDVLAGLDSGW